MDEHKIFIFDTPQFGTPSVKFLIDDSCPLANRLDWPHTSAVELKGLVEGGKAGCLSRFPINSAISRLQIRLLAGCWLIQWVWKSSSCDFEESLAISGEWLNTPLPFLYVMHWMTNVWKWPIVNKWVWGWDLNRHHESMTTEISTWQFVVVIRTTAAIIPRCRVLYWPDVWTLYPTITRPIDNTIRRLHGYLTAD
jgi:hypothetical protein